MAFIMLQSEAKPISFVGKIYILQGIVGIPIIKVVLLHVRYEL